ncbi:Svp26p [Ascoidea rubescens DSM 1968]|uniref:DUF396-domain-containing protein n=1 Tax=Ascoidea rubescens DSM 1968 TaxID=1344418 RepID=A0A1D2VF40_9ASCO|nr:DUF396-domain-containing protein [Ascoidea rubescens DSM 1968]ODV60246.1 DUF396-domain-containing protein [Ascoidea rubescens DSM 1968]
MILDILSYFGISFGFIFLTLAIASGLYYLSELVEEHSEPTKRILQKITYSVIIILILLFVVDGFPLWLILFGIGLNILYLRDLKKFPYLNLDDYEFLLSLGLTLLNHYLWFRYFNNVNKNIPSIEERMRADYKPPHIPSFSEISSFFALCVWLIPFSLFVSLSAGENILPITSTNDPVFRKKSVGLLKVLIAKLRDFCIEVSRTLGIKFGSSSNRHDRYV